MPRAEGANLETINRNKNPNLITVSLVDLQGFQFSNLNECRRMDKSGVVTMFRRLAPVSPAEEQFIMERFSGLSVPAKSHLSREGEVAKEVYFVVKGCVRVYIPTEDGKDITCYFAAEGEFASNYESFVSGKPSDYAVQALEDCELLAIDRMGMQELYTHTTNGERIGRLIAEYLFVETMNRLTSFYKETPEDRYRQFMQERPHLIHRLPQHYIAEYIGVRPQSLSRIKRRALESEH